jgi:hypothetical protein
MNLGSVTEKYIKERFKEGSCKTDSMRSSMKNLLVKKGLLESEYLIDTTVEICPYGTILIEYYSGIHIPVIEVYRKTVQGFFDDLDPIFMLVEPVLNPSTYLKLSLIEVLRYELGDPGDLLNQKLYSRVRVVVGQKEILLAKTKILSHMIEGVDKHLKKLRWIVPLILSFALLITFLFRPEGEKGVRL